MVRAARAGIHKLGMIGSSLPSGRNGFVLLPRIQEVMARPTGRTWLGFIPVGSILSGKGPSRGRLLPKLRRWLEDTSASLSQCISDKEPVFLEIGNSLRDFSTRARELSGRAEALTTLASGTEMQQAITGLETSLQKLRRHWDSEEEYSRRLQGALGELSREIGQLQGDMEAFRPHISQLGMLSLYTRIESARISHEGSGFGNLAGQVDDLAQSTEAHISDISQRAAGTLQIVRRAAGRIHEAGVERTEGMLCEAEEAGKEFERVQERAKQISDSLDERTSSIASAVQEVVSSIQFHDITRQQVEHVTQVLSEAASMLEGDEASREEILAWMGDVCRLQERQLESAAQEFSKALSRIRENLSDIAAKIRAMEQDIASLAQAAESDGASILQRIRDHVDGLMDPMRRALGFWGEFLDDMESTAGEVREMEGCVDQVEAISEQIKLIALNASIQAAHTGEQGRSMGVLAEAVRTLSSEAGELTQRVAARLQRIVSHAEQLRSEADQARELSRSQEQLMSELEEVVRQLQDKEKEMGSALDWLGRESADLASAIETSQADSDLESSVESDLDAARQTLRTVQEQSQNHAPEADSGDSSRSQRLQEILQRYTMESERMVHMTFAGMAPEGAEAAEESSQDHATEQASSEQEATEEDELGDNVELF